MLINHLSRINKIILFVSLSLALHLTCLIVDFSSQPVLQRVQQVGVGLVQRPLTQFSHLENSDQVEGGASTPQATAVSGNKGAVPVRQKHLGSVEPQVPKIHRKSSTAQLEKKNQQPQVLPVDKLPLVVQIEESLLLPSEMQSTIIDDVQSQDVAAEVNDLWQDMGIGEGSFSDASSAATEGGGDTSNTLLSDDTGFRDALPYYDVNPRPKYPAVARRRGQHGTVFLQVSVLADGNVEHASLMESSGYRSLDRAALKAVRRWQFKPATSLGLPVASRVVVPIDFVLDKN